VAFGLVAGLASSQAAMLGLVGVNRGLRGAGPWRVMHLVDEARVRGILRAVGPMYEFRHAALQDYLRAPHESPVGRGSRTSEARDRANRQIALSRVAKARDVFAPALDASRLPPVAPTPTRSRQRPPDDAISELAHGLNTPIAQIEAALLNLTSATSAGDRASLARIADSVSICKALLASYARSHSQG